MVTPIVLATSEPTTMATVSRAHHAFEQLYAEHHDHLVRLAGLLTGRNDQAQDIVADVFARLLVRPLSHDVDDPRAYLRRCVVNEYRTFGRRLARRRALGERVERPPASSASFDEPVTERDRVVRALAQLPDRQRAVLVLRFFEDLSEAETAKVLRVPAGTVKSTTARGAAALRELLREDHP